LRAYANIDPEVGYTQGMNFLAGTLLHLYYSEAIKGHENGEMDIESRNKYEEDVFWIFASIMQKKNWRLLYTNSTPKLHKLLDKLDADMKKKLPQLHKVITESSCLPGCFSQYFLTILLYNSSEDFGKRMLEVFLIAGEDLVSHVLLKVLTVREQEILHKEEMDALYKFLKHDLLKLDF